jgi:hypothetical protein
VSDTLFDLEPVDEREGSARNTHVLLPDMSYACGGSILTKRGHFRVGVGGGNWAKVTCAECRSIGEDVLAAESRAMQGRQADVA